VWARGMVFTSHHDAPVAFPDSMRVLSSTVTRVARGSGEVVGPQHRVPPIVGLKAITLWAAYQHFEEKTKGSIEPGKVADFVVLSANPVRIDPLRIADIQVLETIKEGTSLYRNPALSAGGATTAAAPINEKDNCLVPHDQPQKPLNPAQQFTLDRLLAPRP